MRVLWSASHSIHHNLALEEWLVDHFEEQGPALLFYVSSPSLVFGKNQNPWRESAVGWARREGVAFGRRISGGGTVYHDEGNLNFTLIQSRATYRQADVFAKTIVALQRVGIAAELQNGNSIAAQGKKISGTAFCLRANAAMHHGTLLVRSDLARLRRALVPALPDVETRAIPSKPASVANLADFASGISIEETARALTSELAGTELWETATAPVDSEFDDGLARHSSWNWLFGYTPAFAWPLTVGGVSYRISVKGGVVVALEPAESPAPSWVDLHFDPDDLRAAAADWPDWLAAIPESL